MRRRWKNLNEMPMNSNTATIPPVIIPALAAIEREKEWAGWGGLVGTAAPFVVVLVALAVEITLVLLLIVVEAQCVNVLPAKTSWFFCMVSRVYMLND